jgi:hypothetical protein
MRTGLDFKSAQFDPVRCNAKFSELLCWGLDSGVATGGDESTPPLLQNHPRDMLKFIEKLGGVTLI